MGMEQTLQVVGAILIVGGFVGVQLKAVKPSSLTYLWANLIGSALLAVLALLSGQWGFLLLEGVWAVVSFAGLTGQYRLRYRQAAG
jgi:hypothetical protein